MTMMKNFLKGLSCLALMTAGSPVLAQNLDDVEIQVLKVRDDIHMLVGAGGNITVQTGDEGVLIIDTQYAQLSEKILATIRTNEGQYFSYPLTIKFIR